MSAETFYKYSKPLTQDKTKWETEVQIHLFLPTDQINRLLQQKPKGCFGYLKEKDKERGRKTINL